MNEPSPAEGAARYVRLNPGCPKIDAVMAGWGRRGVERAIEQGLIRAERQSSGAYKLYPADGTGEGT